MNVERYDYFNSNNYRNYFFYSEGPKGRIKKLVSFTNIPYAKPTTYNLAFGDEDPVIGGIDDSIITDNQDRDIVLATVANTVVEFSAHFDNPYIYAKGSTSSRTRLYQMGIAGLWNEIGIYFEVFGLIDDEWEEFKPNSVNYEAFLVKRKELFTFEY